MDELLAAMLAADTGTALAVADRARARGHRFLYEEVVQPALVRVGQLWQEGRISIADEHIATSVVQSVLAAGYPSFPWVTDGPRGIISCVAGERHELGARIAADLLAQEGWTITYVGADLPVDALVELVVREAPVFVGLSVALRERLPEVVDVIARLRRAAPTVKLIVGGRAIHGRERPALDADVIAVSAAAAADAIRSWRP